MSFQQFPNDIFVKTFQTGVIEDLCSFQNDESISLNYILLTMLKYGPAVGGESMVLKVYANSDTTRAPLFSSEPRLMSDCGAANADSWIGTMRFDFNGENISSVDTYYLAIELSNYIDTTAFFIGAIGDWPATVYETDDTGLRGAQIRLIGSNY